MSDLEEIRRRQMRFMRKLLRLLIIIEDANIQIVVLSL